MSKGSVVRQRTLGTTEACISQVTFGSMRLPVNSGVEPTARFLAELFDRGVDTHHSSMEYDTYSSYARAVHRLRSSGRRPKHIVKVAEPSFDNDRFDAKRFVSRIDDELRALDTDVLHNVQWLVRTADPGGDGAHDALRRALEMMPDLSDRLVSSGKVHSISAFPYTSAAAALLVDSGAVNALCAYLNLVEHLECSQLEAVPAIALRPLSGGALSSKNPHWLSTSGKATLRPIVEAMPGSPADASLACAGWPLLHPNVATIVLSVADDNRVGPTLKALGGIEPHESAFRAMQSLSRSLPGRDSLLQMKAS